MRYYEPFLFSLDSKVISVSGNAVELEETIFYPGGGGQPCDTGALSNDSFQANVTRVWKDNGRVLHQLEIIKGSVKPQDLVKEEINRDRRIRLTKMHTGEHILFQALSRSTPTEVHKVDLGEQESTLYVNCKELSWDILLKAEQLANQVVAEDRPIRQELVPRDQLESGLRIKLDRIKDEKIRVVDVKDFDLAACAGTHCQSSREVGNILVLGFTQAGEIRFTVDCLPKTLELAGTARKLASELGTNAQSLNDSVAKLVKDREDLTFLRRQKSAEALQSVQKQELAKADFYSGIFQHADKHQLMQRIGELCTGNSVVCFVNASGVCIISIASSGNVNCLDLLNTIAKQVPLKGGGKQAFSSGQLPREYAEQAISIAREQLF